jgi:bacteriorhodopsin
MPDLPNEPDERPRYRWPWFVLAAVLLFVVLTVVWVSFAVKKVERERNFTAPPLKSSPAR